MDKQWLIKLQKYLDKKLKDTKMAMIEYQEDLGGSEYISVDKLVTSDGKTAKYYELPEGAKEIQDLISFKNMNSQMGEIGRAWYRYGQCSHSDELREINKIIFYAEAEKERLIKYCGFNEK